MGDKQDVKGKWGQQLLRPEMGRNRIIKVGWLAEPQWQGTHREQDHVIFGGDFDDHPRIIRQAPILRDDNRASMMYKGHRIHEGGGFYSEASERFLRGDLPGIIRTLKANVHDASVCVRISERKYRELNEKKGDRVE